MHVGRRKVQWKGQRLDIGGLIGGVSIEGTVDSFTNEGRGHTTNCSPNRFLD